VGREAIREGGLPDRECWICRHRSKAVCLIYIHPPTISPISSAQAYQLIPTHPQQNNKDEKTSRRKRVLKKEYYGLRGDYFP
jgi:hypothetical protein